MSHGKIDQHNTNRCGIGMPNPILCAGVAGVRSMPRACSLGGEDVLMEMSSDVSAVRDFWRVMSSGAHAQLVGPPPGPPRCRPRIRPFSTIKEVRSPGAEVHFRVRHCMLQSWSL